MKKAFNQMTYSSYDERDTAVSLTAVDLGMYGGGSRTLITDKDEHIYTLSKNYHMTDGGVDRCASLVASDWKDPPAVGRGMSVRRLTPLECCRLQGFPDDWCDGVEGSDTDQYKMWGNGVALPVVYYIMLGIAEVMKDESNKT